MSAPERLTLGQGSRKDLPTSFGADRRASVTRSETSTADDADPGFRVGRDAQLRRDRVPASPPPGSRSRTRQSHPPVLAQPPRFVRFLQPQATDPSQRTDRRAPRRRGAPIAVAQPRAYARPGSSTAATPVDLAAAIAQIRACAGWARHDCSTLAPARAGLLQRHGCSDGGARLLPRDAIAEPSHDCSGLKE